MTWTFIPATVWFMIVDLFPCICLNFHRWFEPVEFWLNWFSIPAKLLNRYSWANVWIFIDDLNQLNFDRWIDPIFPRNYWTVIPEQTFDFSTMIWTGWILIELIQYSREIVEPLFLSDRLNFDPIFPPHCWTVIPEQTSFIVDLNRLNFDSVFPRQLFPNASHFLGSFLGKRTIARTNFSENTVKAILFSRQFTTHTPRGCLV